MKAGNKWVNKRFEEWWLIAPDGEVLGKVYPVGLGIKEYFSTNAGKSYLTPSQAKAATERAL